MRRVEKANTTEISSLLFRIGNRFPETRKEITLSIHASILDRVLDYCPFRNFRKDGEDHYLVAFPFIDSDYWYDVLLSFGDKCTCVSPESVREKLKDKIGRMAALYY